MKTLTQDVREVDNVHAAKLFETQVEVGGLVALLRNRASCKAAEAAKRLATARQDKVNHRFLVYQHL